MQLRKALVAGWFVALVMAVSVSVGCHSTDSLRLPPEPAREPAHQTPKVMYEPLSWKKLEEIEDYLSTPESQRDPLERLELELILNEGRVTFASRDAERASVPHDALRIRLEAARSGFEALLKEHDLMPGQASRAQIGLKQVDALVDSMKKAPPKAGLVIIERKVWGAAPAATARLTPLRGTWSQITVHHSDETTSDPNGGSLDDSAHTLRLIQKYHMESKSPPWGDIGYHFVIDSAGRIFQGRELRWRGAHAGGKDGENNEQNIGICMLGDFLKRPPTPAAMKSLELLIADLRQKYNIANSRLFSHHEFTGTDCPGPFLIDWVKKHR